MTGTYRVVSLGRQVGIGIAGSQFVTLQAVAKVNGPNAHYCIPNELICGVIGRFLGLPVPPSAVIEAPGAPTPLLFASLDFNLTGNALPPVDTADCFARLPDLSTGLLLFDALVANCDRHRANFAVDQLATPARMNVFDHSHALFGYAAGQGRSRLAELRDRLGMSGGTRTGGNRHCLIEVVSTDAHFGKWLDRISALPDFFIEETCKEPVGQGIAEEEANAAIEFLRYRRDHLRDIIDGGRHEFTAIQQWSLFR